MRVAGALCIALLSVGCKPPPDAPHDLDALASYLFEHLMDDDSAPLEVGLGNLDVWLDAHFEETSEGYKVTGLTEEAAATLGVDVPDLTNQIGAAVGYDIAYPLDDVIHTLLLAPRDELWGEDGEENVFVRTHLSDVECFVEGDCEYYAYDAYIENYYPLGVSVKMDYRGQYRWVNTRMGRAIVQRTFLTGETDVTPEWLKLLFQSFVAIMFPKDGDTRRLESGWLVVELGEAGIPEDFALNYAIDMMKEQGEQITNYPDAQ